MYLVKIPPSNSVDVPIYRKKCKTFIKNNIKIVKSLICKFKVGSLRSCQKINFWLIFVLSVFTKLHIFYQYILRSC